MTLANTVVNTDVELSLIYKRTMLYNPLQEHVDTSVSARSAIARLTGVALARYIGTQATSASNSALTALLPAPSVLDHSLTGWLAPAGTDTQMDLGIADLEHASQPLSRHRTGLELVTLLP